MPVVITAVFIPAEGRRDDLLNTLRATMLAVHAEPGCDLYAIHEAADGSVVLIEKWASQEALDGHSAGEPMAVLVGAVTELLGGPLTVTTMKPVPVGGTAGAL